MKHHYSDITGRIAQPPMWYDEHGVPRYDAFEPRQTASIYAHEAALVEIACQSCETRFLVAFTASNVDEYRLVLAHAKGEPYVHRTLADAIRDHSIHYGDPPNAGCCPAGPTMNSVPLRVVEYWRRDHNVFEWARDLSLEMAIICSWSDPDQYGPTVVA